MPIDQLTMVAGTFIFIKNILIRQTWWLIPPRHLTPFVLFYRSRSKNNRNYKKQVSSYSPVFFAAGHQHEDPGAAQRLPWLSLQTGFPEYEDKFGWILNALIIIIMFWRACGVKQWFDDLFGIVVSCCFWQHISLPNHHLSSSLHNPHLSPSWSSLQERKMCHLGYLMRCASAY